MSLFFPTNGSIQIPQNHSLSQPLNKAKEKEIKENWSGQQVKAVKERPQVLQLSFLLINATRGG